MPVLSSFSPPANQNDFPNSPPLEDALRAQWNTNANGWTQQAIVGNPWQSTGAANQTSYYNPLVTDIPSGTSSALVSWNVPGNAYPSLSQLLSLELEIAADAPLGLQSVQVTNFGQSPAAAAPAFLNVVSAGTIGKRAAQFVICGNI